MIGHGSEGATALFDMAGFVVRAHVLDDGEWWLLVETAADRVGCAACGVRAVGSWPPAGAGAGSADRGPAGAAGVGEADLAVSGRRLRDRDVERDGTIQISRAGVVDGPSSDRDLPPSRRGTRDSVAQVAREFGIGWHTAMAAVREHGERTRR